MAQSEERDGDAIQAEDEVAAEAAEAASTEDGVEESAEAEGRGDELTELRERLQRTTAEYQNYRRQVEKRQQEIRRFAARDVLISLLPVVDNFDMAMMAVDKGQDPDGIVAGVRMIHENLRRFLSDHQVQPIEAVGSEFDPALHEAVSTVETDEVAENAIVSVLQKGYLIADNVLRHARVSVAKSPAPSEDPPAEE